MSIAEKLQTIAENEQRVFEAGKKSEYDRFWDSLQQNGSRTNYSYAFGNWVGEFKPKYNMQPTSAYMMFRNFNSLSSQMIDLVEVLENAEVTLDFSNCSNLAYAFHDSVYFSRIGIIDTRKCSGLTTVMSGCLAHTIDKIIFREDGSQALSGNPFTSMSNLKNITIEGTIGQNFNISSSPLTKASITSIISALSDETTDKTVTFKKTAVNTAFETSEGAADGSTSEEWLNLIATKSNWTITLV